jgi:hypothetical protein
MSLFRVLRSARSLEFPAATASATTAPDAACDRMRRVVADAERQSGDSYIAYKAECDRVSTLLDDAAAIDAAIEERKARIGSMRSEALQFVKGGDIAEVDAAMAQIDAAERAEQSAIDQLASRARNRRAMAELLGESVKRTGTAYGNARAVADRARLELCRLELDELSNAVDGDIRALAARAGEWIAAFRTLDERWFANFGERLSGLGHNPESIVARALGEQFVTMLGPHAANQFATPNISGVANVASRLADLGSRMRSMLESQSRGENPRGDTRSGGAQVA